jgi:hypothetical protein
MAQPRHGAVSWSVYLAIGPHSSQPVEDAKRRARAIGYELGHMDPACNERLGATASLWPNTDDEVYVVVAYFDSEADARRFARALPPPPPLWIGRTKTYCLDGAANEERGEGEEKGGVE